MNILQVKNTTFQSNKSDKKAKFTYSPLEKASVKQKKVIEDQRKKQIKT